jgi:transposase
VSAATAVRLAQRQAETGSLAPGRQGRPAGSGKLGAYREIVIGWVEADGELTLCELAERLAREHGVAVHHTSVSRTAEPQPSCSTTPTSIAGAWLS